MDENLGVPSPPDDNPEMSRRGAFAAGGLALAALVAGGCGWLAMNAKKGEDPVLSARMLDEPSAATLSGASYTMSEQEEMLDAGIDAAAAYTYLTPKTTQAKQQERMLSSKEFLLTDVEQDAEIQGEDQETAYVEFSFDSLNPGVPYLLACDVYLTEWAYIDEEDVQNLGPVDRDDKGRAGFISSKEHLTRTGVVIVPEKSSGTICSAFSRPSNLRDDQQLITRSAWQRLDIH